MEFKEEELTVLSTKVTECEHGLSQLEERLNAEQEKIKEVIPETNSVDIQDVLQKIDNVLPIHMRKIYLQMRAGLKPPKKERELLEKMIFSILKEELSIS